MFLSRFVHLKLYILIRFKLSSVSSSILHFWNIISRSDTHCLRGASDILNDSTLMIHSHISVLISHIVWYRLILAQNSDIFSPWQRRSFEGHSTGTVNLLLVSIFYSVSCPKSAAPKNPATYFVTSCCHKANLHFALVFRHAATAVQSWLLNAIIYS